MKLPPQSDHVRVDTGVIQGDEVSVFYDPMIAKLIVHGRDRDTAISNLLQALHQYQIVGLPTNIEFVARTAGHPEFRKGGVDTSFLKKYGDQVLKPLPTYSKHVQALGAVCLVLLQQGRANRRLDAGISQSLWGSESSLKYYRSLETLERHFQLRFDENHVNVGVKCRATDRFEVVLSEQNGDQHHQKQVPTEIVRAKGKVELNGEFAIRVNDRMYKGSAVVMKDHLHLFCDDRTERYEYKFRIPIPALDAIATAGGAGDNGSGMQSRIMTPMPGKIIKILVKQGEAIKANQPLLIMEAMKMEHVLRASKDGHVEEVFCGMGDFVTDGQILMTLE